MTGIINYGAGNIRSLTCALDRIGEQYKLISHDKEFGNADRYIIPGVGHAKTAIEKLQTTGLIPHLINTTKPVLGICLGMQLLSAFSEEGDVGLLDTIPVMTKKFLIGEKIPHVGWNSIRIKKDFFLFNGLSSDTFFYFVHSFYVEEHMDFTIASSYYAHSFSAAIARNNFVGVQFHPEKSGLAGEKILQNFIRMS